MSVTVIHEKCDLEKDNNNKLPYTAYVIQYELEQSRLFKCEFQTRVNFKIQ